MAASRGAAGRWAAEAAAVAVAAAASICEWLPRVAVVSYGVGGVIIHEILGHLAGWNHIAPAFGHLIKFGSCETDRKIL